MTQDIPLRNQRLINQFLQTPRTERIHPSYRNSIMIPDYLHQADILYLPTDSGYKYLLTLIDVHNSLAGAYPLKNMDSSSLIDALEHVYRIFSDYLRYPKVLQVDNQFNIRPIITWANNNGIKIKPTLPYRHRQNAYVERFNQQMGHVLFKIMLDKEITTNQVSTEWVRYVHALITSHNDKILERLTNRKRPSEPIRPIRFNRNSNYIIRNGTFVRRILDYPVDYFGKKLHGDFRKTDIRWSRDLYRVVDTIMVPGNPPLYKIIDSDSKPVKALYTNEQLQIVPL